MTILNGSITLLICVEFQAPFYPLCVNKLQNMTVVAIIAFILSNLSILPIT